MGTWDTGPFDKDTAADFAIALDQTKPEARKFLIRSVLDRTVNATGYLTEVSTDAFAGGHGFVCAEAEAARAPSRLVCEWRRGQDEGVTIA